MGTRFWAFVPKSRHSRWSDCLVRFRGASQQEMRKRELNPARIPILFWKKTSGLVFPAWQRRDFSSRQQEFHKKPCHCLTLFRQEASKYKKSCLTAEIGRVTTKDPARASPATQWEGEAGLMKWCIQLIKFCYAKKVPIESMSP